MTSKPFIFPSQVTQVFFSTNLKKSSYKVVLRKEACSRREVANVEDVFITTTIEPCGLNVIVGLPPPPSTSLIGVIELLNKDNLLASTQF
jgi:hypothetical protein